METTLEMILGYESACEEGEASPLRCLKALATEIVALKKRVQELEAREEPVQAQPWLISKS